jgi:hypothetical protein
LRVDFTVVSRARTRQHAMHHQHVNDRVSTDLAHGEIFIHMGIARRRGGKRRDESNVYGQDVRGGRERREGGGREAEDRE